MPLNPETAEFFEEKTTTKPPIVKLWVAVRPMTAEQARKSFPYRPNSKYAESRWGGDNLYDDICLLMNGLAARCTMCQAPTRIEYLRNDVCPDCGGDAQFNGRSPHPEVK